MKQLSKLFTLLAATMLLTGLWSCSSSSDDNEIAPEPTQQNSGDLKVPSINIMSPTSEESYVTNEATLTVSGTASDDVALKSVTYSTNRGVSGEAAGLDNWTINGLSLQDGDNVLTVTATDKADKTKTASLTITKNRYLIFFGIPNIDNELMYTGVPSERWITVSIAPNDKLLTESVRLIEVDADGKEIASVCQLYDDGNLSDHGDEIKGDNIYSVVHSFNETAQKTKRFRIAAKTLEAEGEVEGYSAIFTVTVIDQANAEQQVKLLVATQEDIEEKMTQIAASGMSDTEKTDAMAAWLKEQESVKEVEKEGAMLKVVHQTGLVSYVMPQSGKTMKGAGPGDRRSNVQTIPLSRQTRGICARPASSRRKAAPSAAEMGNIIQNKKVLIWAAFADQFDIDMEPSLRQIFSDSPVGLDIVYKQNKECDVNSLMELANYGIIVLDTHGANGDLILTREEAKFGDEFSASDVAEVAAQFNLVSQQYQLVTMSDGVTYYAVTSKFIRKSVRGTLPNSIVFNGSCESLKTDNLSNAFISKGAKTYLGFSEVVMTNTCVEKADEFFKGLVGDELKKTGDSYVADTNISQSDGSSSWTNAYLMRGSTEMHFYLGLINGDFEFGNINGWSVSGDGRVITQLGPINPTQGTFMGIVSTGLGYTTNYGSISQTFRVNTETQLTIRYNFLSEEFMEYVGSIYQDYLRIAIICDGEEHQLMRTAIDNFANDGYWTLTKVSPDIVFDRGDVYQTGWMTVTYDISAYQGKTVTLVLDSGDVGDSIYDSATLLDEISIH